MLGDRDVTTLVSVKDLAEATPFYEDALGLTKVGENPGFVQFRSGASHVIVTLPARVRTTAAEARPQTPHPTATAPIAQPYWTTASTMSAHATLR